MELEMHIKGALAQLPGDFVSDAQFRIELERRGLSAGDAEQAIEKALIEGWVTRTGDGLTKLEWARSEAVPGNLAKS